MTKVVLEPITILYYIPNKLGPGYEGLEFWMRN